jgi:predicted anti-sigma-YlaC factor YlaD
VKCESVREALSATLDSEDPGVEPALLDAHLAGCAACAAWYDQASRVDRLARIAPVTTPEVTAEDLAARVLAQVALPRRSHRRRALALALALNVVAVAQLVLGVVALFAPLGTPIGDLIHMDHETAAFNLAFGVILLLVALNGRHARTMVPVLATFIAVHGTGSLIDLANGTVGPAHLATHLPVIAGLILTAAIGINRRPDPGLDTAHTPDPRSAATDQALTDQSEADPAAPSHKPRPAPPAAHRKAG